MNKGKPYPRIEEEEDSCMTACEPGAVPQTVPYVDYDIADDDDDFDPYEGRGDEDFGFPRTWEEVEAEIDYSEAHWDDPDEWVTSEEMWAEIRKLFPWAKFK